MIGWLIGGGGGRADVQRAGDGGWGWGVGTEQEEQTLRRLIFKCKIGKTRVTDVSEIRTSHTKHTVLDSVPAGSASRGGDVAVHVFDIN